jgi:hypothetical protein
LNGSSRGVELMLQRKSLNNAINRAAVDRSEKVKAFRRLANFSESVS